MHLVPEEHVEVCRWRRSVLILCAVVRRVQTDHALDQQMWSQNAKWQYWVDDGVDGKTDGATVLHPLYQDPF